VRLARLLAWAARLVVRLVVRDPTVCLGALPPSLLCCTCRPTGVALMQFSGILGDIYGMEPDIALWE